MLGYYIMASSNSAKVITKEHARLETFINFADKDKVSLSGYHLDFWNTNILLQNPRDPDKVSDQLEQYDELFIKYCINKPSLNYLLTNIVGLVDAMNIRLAELKTYVESKNINYKCRYFIADSTIYVLTQVMVLGVVSFWTDKKIIESIKNVLSNSHRNMILCITVSNMEPQRIEVDLPSPSPPDEPDEHDLTKEGQELAIVVYNDIKKGFIGQREDTMNGQWLTRITKGQVPLSSAPAQANTSSMLSLCSIMDIIVRTKTHNPLVSDFITTYHENAGDSAIEHWEAVELWLWFRSVTVVRDNQVYLSAVYTTDLGVPLDEGYVVDAGGTPYMIDYGVILEAKLERRITKNWDKLKFKPKEEPKDFLNNSNPTIYQVYSKVFKSFSTDLTNLMGPKPKPGDKKGNTKFVSLSLAYKATITKMSSDLWANSSKYVLLHMESMAKNSKYKAPQSLDDKQAKAVYLYIIGLGLNKSNLSKLKGSGPLGDARIGKVGRIGMQAPYLPGNGAHLETEGVDTAMTDSAVTHVFERNIQKLDPFTMVVLGDGVFLASSGIDMYPNPGLSRASNYVTVESATYNKRNDTPAYVPEQFSGKNITQFTEGPHKFGMPPGVREVGRCCVVRNMYKFDRKEFFTMMLRVGGYGYITYIVKKYTFDPSNLISMMVGVMSGHFPIEPDNVEKLYTYLVAIRNISQSVTNVDVSLPIYIEKFFRSLTGIDEANPDVTKSDLISVRLGLTEKRIEPYEWETLSVYQRQIYGSDDLSLFGDVELWLDENQDRWSQDARTVPTVSDVALVSQYYIKDLNKKVEHQHDQIKEDRENTKIQALKVEKELNKAVQKLRGEKKIFAQSLLAAKTPRDSDNNEYYLGMPAPNLLLNTAVYDTLIKILGEAEIYVDTPIEELKNKLIGMEFTINGNTPYESIEDLCENFSNLYVDEYQRNCIKQVCLLEKIAHLTMKAGTKGIPNLKLNIYETLQVIEVISRAIGDFPFKSENAEGQMVLTFESRDQLKNYVMSTEYVWGGKKAKKLKVGNSSFIKDASAAAGIIKDASAAAGVEPGTVLPVKMNIEGQAGPGAKKKRKRTAQLVHTITALNNQRSRIEFETALQSGENAKVYTAQEAGEIANELKKILNEYDAEGINLELKQFILQKIINGDMIAVYEPAADILDKIEAVLDQGSDDEMLDQGFDDAGVHLGDDPMAEAVGGGDVDGGSRKRRKPSNKRKSPKTLKKRRKQVRKKTIKRNYKRNKKSVLKNKKPNKKIKKTIRKLKNNKRMKKSK